MALFAALALTAAGCHGPPVGPPLGAGQAGASGVAGTGGNTGAGGNAATAGTTGAAGVTGGGGRGGAAGSVAGTGGMAGGAGATGRSGPRRHDGNRAPGGTTGTAGRGGSGGAAGAGCAAQMTAGGVPSGGPPRVRHPSTSTRYYWVEYGSQPITVHDPPGAAPAHNQHMLEIDSSIANGYEITASDQRVAATWNLEGKLAVWGPDSDSIQIGPTMTLSYPSAIDVEGTTVFYSYQPQTGTDTQGIYQWSPDSRAPAVRVIRQPGRRPDPRAPRARDARQAAPQRQDRCLVGRPDGEGREAAPVEQPDHTPHLRGPPGPPAHGRRGRAHQSDRCGPHRRARPLCESVAAQRPCEGFLGGDRDAPDRIGVPTPGRYNGGGVLFNQRYVYEGTGGLFAVDVSPNGDVSNLVRLTDIPLRYPEVTGDGYLFAGWAYQVSQWDFYRVGRL